jgi:exopolysaccharide biosynthesis polyprenyl glycosylphosphotransferase
VAARRDRDYIGRRVMAAADVLAIGAAGTLAFLLTPVSGNQEQILWLIPILPCWVATFGIYGLYQSDSKRVTTDALDDLPSIFHALALGTLAMWLYFRVVPAHRLVFMQALTFSLLGLALVPLFRSLARRVIVAWRGPERILFLGESRSLPALVRKIRTHPEYGLEAVGLVSRDASAEASVPLPVLGRVGDGSLPEIVERYGVERLIVSRRGASDDEMLDLHQLCRDHAVHLSLLPVQVDAIGPSVEVDDIEGITVLGVNPLALSRSSRMTKRAMDIVGASVGLVLFSPVLVVAALAIKLDSRGPVTFRQRRIGRRGEAFRVVKLRTMVTRAEDQAEELRAESADPGWLKLDHDPRVTRVGRWLRTASIDELPQLWNVLRGDMSLVGPRPLIESEHPTVTAWGRTRTDLAPGITGLWQVLGRTNIPFEEMVKLDYLYVTNWSLWLDVQLLLKTFPVVVRRRGAN